MRAVHRRRRFTALVGLLVAVAIVVALIVWRPWESIGADDQPNADPGASEAPTPSEEPVEPEPSPTPTAQYTPIGGVPEGGDGESGTCQPGAVAITPLTDATTYSAGQPVQMSFAIVNTGADPCILNVGTTQQEYTISTGNLVVFRSSDCPIEGVDQVVTLEPGVEQQTIPIAWDQTYSSPETCAIARDQVIAGGASYHLQVTVSGIASAGTKQILLY